MLENGTACSSEPIGMADDSEITVMPSGVAGEFLGHFSNGHALGAFGADMVPAGDDAVAVMN